MHSASKQTPLPLLLYRTTASPLPIRADRILDARYTEHAVGALLRPPTERVTPDALIHTAKNVILRALPASTIAALRAQSRAAFVARRSAPPTRTLAPPQCEQNQLVPVARPDEGQGACGTPHEQPQRRNEQPENGREMTPQPAHACPGEQQTNLQLAPQCSVHPDAAQPPSGPTNGSKLRQGDLLPPSSPLSFADVLLLPEANATAATPAPCVSASIGTAAPAQLADPREETPSLLEQANAGTATREAWSDGGERTGRANKA